MSNSVSDIADILELQAWASEQPYSVSTLKEQLEAALPLEEQSNAETLAREVFEEMSERARLLKNSYPFTHNGVMLAANSTAISSSYLFCLGLSWFEDKEIAHFLRTREFEEIVKTAAEGYFRGQAIRIGAPWKTGQVTSYEILLNQVSILIPDLGPPIRKVAPAGGDAGWDVVLVNNFSDGMFSRIIVLGNCATGKTDWRKKGLETQPALFWSFFSHSPHALNVCLTFIAVPFLMTAEDKLRKAGATCLTFDRLRICEHSPSTSSDVVQWLASRKQAALDIPFL